MRIPQPRIIVFALAIYCLLIRRLGHVHAVYSVDSHMLHLRTARCGRSAAASAVASWAACTRDSPSAPNRTYPLAIYLHLVAIFLFWRQFSTYSFPFLLALAVISGTSYNIAAALRELVWPCLQAWRARINLSFLCKASCCCGVAILMVVAERVAFLMGSPHGVRHLVR